MTDDAANKCIVAFVVFFTVCCYNVSHLRFCHVHEETDVEFQFFKNRLKMLWKKNKAFKVGIQPLSHIMEQVQACIQYPHQYFQPESKQLATKEFQNEV